MLVGGGCGLGMDRWPKDRNRLDICYTQSTMSLSQRDQQLLDALATYPFLTIRQLCQLVFGRLSARTYCATRLARLYRARLVDRLYLARSYRGGSLAVYTLRRRNKVQRSPQFLEHTLAVADCLLHVRAYCQTRPDLAIGKVLQEGELKKDPVRVQDGSREVAVIPDAYLQLYWQQAGRCYTLPLAIEIDRGTEASRVWRAKVRRYLAFVARGYPERFGTHALTVVVLTTAGPKRLRTLVQAIEGELTRLGQRQQADLFRIASADPAREEPREVLARPRFSVPFQQGTVPLLPEE
jgi:hypothetical protein